MRHFAWLTGFVVIVAMVAAGWAATGTTSEKAMDKNFSKLVANLTNESLEKRAEAAQKLGEKCCKDAVPHLVKMMQNDAVASARIVAANALAKIGDTSVIPQMLEQSKTDKNKTVRYTLSVIAEEMSKKKAESAG